jgi:hypothetical protein
VCFRKPLTVIFPLLADCEIVAVCPPSVAVAVNDVHGDALDDAEKFTSARSALTRSPEAVTLNGRQTHLAYSVEYEPEDHDSPSTQARTPVGVDAHPSNE